MVLKKASTLPLQLPASRFLALEIHCTTPQHGVPGRISTIQFDILSCCKCVPLAATPVAAFALQAVAASRGHQPSTIAERKALTIFAAERESECFCLRGVPVNCCRAVQDIPQDRSVCGRQALGIFLCALNRSNQHFLFFFVHAQVGGIFVSFFLFNSKAMCR